MRIDCEAARDAVDAWALGALDADERRPLEAHLATCAACAGAADQAREASLKSRVIASAAVLTDLGRSRARRWYPAAISAAVIVGVSAVAWGTFMQTRVNDLEDRNTAIGADATAQAGQLVSVRSELWEATSAAIELQETVDTQNAVIEISLQPDATVTELEGTATAPSARGRCVWSRAEALGAFVGKDLPRPSEGYAYRMWLVYENEWLDGGSFDVDEDGTARLVVRRPEGDHGDIGPFLGFVVTLEPLTGTDERRGAMVLESR
jgi:hypothetical protein